MWPWARGDGRCPRGRDRTENETMTMNWRSAMGRLCLRPQRRRFALGRVFSGRKSHRPP
jgi:hypothetical protein